MKYNQNLHTHTTYCDGKDKPEDMIKRAIELGFDSIGFSGHAPMESAEGWTLTKESILAYKNEIRSLKSKYEGLIKVYCGIEDDLYSDEDLSSFDYIIGSMHFMKINGETVEFDCSKDIVNRLIDEYFGGDGLKYAQNYYREIVKLKDKKLDIVGHFDIITKHSEKVEFFDTESKEYKNYALEAITALSEKHEIFEVNTGAVARGYRKTVYPAPFIMKRLKELDCKIVLSSDCHDKKYLDFMFDDALEYIRSFGFNSVYKLINGQFLPLNI